MGKPQPKTNSDSEYDSDSHRRHRRVTRSTPAAPKRTVSLCDGPPPDPPIKLKRLKQHVHDRLAPAIRPTPVHDRLAPDIRPTPVQPIDPHFQALPRRRALDQRRNRAFNYNLIRLTDLRLLCHERQDWAVAIASGLSPESHIQWHSHRCPSPGCTYISSLSGAERFTNLPKHLHHAGTHTNSDGTTTSDPLHQGILTYLLHSLTSRVPGPSICAVGILPDRNAMDIGGIPTGISNTELAYFTDNLSISHACATSPTFLRKPSTT